MQTNYAASKKQKCTNCIDRHTEFTCDKCKKPFCCYCMEKYSGEYFCCQCAPKTLTDELAHTALKYANDIIQQQGEQIEQLQTRIRQLEQAKLSPNHPLREWGEPI